MGGRKTFFAKGAADGAGAFSGEAGPRAPAGLRADYARFPLCPAR